LFIWRLIAQITKNTSLTGVAVSGFLVLSGLGFLFGVMYYTVAWAEREPPKWIVTFRLAWLWKILGWLGRMLHIKLGADLHRALQEGERKDWLKLRCATNGDVEAINLTKRGAWRVVSSYLNLRAGSSTQIKEAWEGGLQRLSDLMNSLGTTCMACIASLLAFVIFVILRRFGWFWEKSEVSVLSLVIVGIVAILALIVHIKNYKGVIEDYENVCGSILLNEFECQYYNKIPGPPITLYVFQNDLKNEFLKGKEREKNLQRPLTFG
jgi:hypothetical protein